MADILPGVDTDLNLQAFDEALAELRFDDAERLIESAGGRAVESLARRVESERSRARDAAQQVYQQIVQFGAEDDYAAIFALEKDPSTRPLLGQLAEADQRRAELHLAAGVRWAAVGSERNERRLSEARHALDQFDLELARGLIVLLDDRFMDEEAVERKNRLLLDIEARRMELAPLREAQERLASSSPSDQAWWKRFRR